MRGCKRRWLGLPRCEVHPKRSTSWGRPIARLRPGAAHQRGQLQRFRMKPSPSKQRWVSPKPLHPFAVRVMAERGLDISGRSAKPLTRFARARFDRVITLCDRVREVCPSLPGPPLVTWASASA